MYATQPVVSWREIGGRESLSSVLLSAPAGNAGFTEDSCYRFCSEVQGLSLLVDDEPLSNLSRVESEWEWRPGFYAGEVTAELRSAEGAVVERYLLDVSPEPRKLGRDLFEQMLRDLREEIPELLFGDEPATAAAGELGEHQNPWLEFSRLRRYLPQFLSALQDVVAKPRRALRTARRSAPLHQVRQVDRHTLAVLLRSSALSLLDESGRERRFDLQMRLDVPTADETVDSAANRAMLALLHAVRRRTLSVHAALQKRVDNDDDSDTRTELVSRWPIRKALLEEFESRLSALMRRSPFDRVSRAETTAAGLNAISADPIYARAWGRGWRALRHGVEGELTDRLWVSPSWEVYEGWCFLQLGRLLAGHHPEWDWNLIREPEPVWVGRNGYRRAELTQQASFAAYPAERSGRWSISRRRRPDMVLTVMTEDHARFLTIDAKYRVSRANVLDAMSSAHVYQDSLRIGDNRPTASLLAVPAAGGAEWLEDPDFQDMHRVGIFVLSPDGAGGLPRPVSRLLEEES